MPRHIVVDDVEELLDILHQADPSNAVVPLAQRLQRFHRPIPQALFDKALARVLDIVHLSEGNQRQRTQIPPTARYADATRQQRTG